MGMGVAKGGHYSTAAQTPPAWSTGGSHTGSNPRYAPDGTEQFSYGFGFQAPPQRPSQDYQRSRRSSGSASREPDLLDTAATMYFGSLFF